MNVITQNEIAFLIWSPNLFSMKMSEHYNAAIEWLDSIRGNAMRRVTNPFLGTLLAVWIIRNFEFVYTLFYFNDSGLFLDSRIAYINEFYANYSLRDGAVTIGVTFLVMTATYILLNFSRLIVNIFDKIVYPIVLWLTDRGSVVPKEEFKRVISQIEKKEKELDDEKDRRRNLESEISKLENRLNEIQASNKEQDLDEINKIRNELNALSETANDSFNEETYLEALKEIDILQQENKIDDFLKVAGLTLNAEHIEKKYARYFAQRELITFREIDRLFDGFAFYDLTTLGENVNRILKKMPIESRYRKIDDASTLKSIATGFREEIVIGRLKYVENCIKKGDSYIENFLSKIAYERVEQPDLMSFSLSNLNEHQIHALSQYRSREKELSMFVDNVVNEDGGHSKPPHELIQLYNNRLKKLATALDRLIDSLK